MPEPQSDKFESWGLLELFGHQRLAGKLSEQTIGGCSFIRVDVPAVGDAPAYTRFFTSGAIYGMTPTSEAVARGLAERMRAVPVTVYDLPRLAEPIANPGRATASVFSGDDDPDDDKPF